MIESDRPLDPGQFVVENVASGFNWTAQTEDGRKGGWAPSRAEAKGAARRAAEGSA